MHKDIPVYEGLYSITEEGVVLRHHSTYTKPVLGRQNTGGYIAVSLSKRGDKPKQFLVHRLVAEAFIPNPDNLPLVDHIDEDKTNNKVSNLRWCTAKDNNTYYCTKDGRRHQIELAKERKAKLKKYEALLAEKSSSISALQKELSRKEKELLVLASKIAKAEEALVKKETQLQEAVKKLALRESSESYSGYMDTKGVTFKSVEEMIDIAGKPVKIDGIEFPSCGAAAKYIVEEEAKVGELRSKATISKELRRYLQGLRGSWKMYGKYLVT